METYILCLTIFIGILTVALAVQAIAVFLISRRVSRLADELEKTVARLSNQSATIMQQVTTLLNEVNKQATHYGHVGSEISARVQQTVNGFFNSVDRVGSMASNGAAAVVREASAAIQGVVATLAHLGRRPPRKQLPPPERHSSSLH